MNLKYKKTCKIVKLYKNVKTINNIQNNINKKYKSKTNEK